MALAPLITCCYCGKQRHPGDRWGSGSVDRFSRVFCSFDCAWTQDYADDDRVRDYLEAVAAARNAQREARARFGAREDIPAVFPAPNELALRRRTPTVLEGYRPPPKFVKSRFAKDAAPTFDDKGALVGEWHAMYGMAHLLGGFAD